MALTKKKAASAVAAVGVAAALALGGTFAWQSISQTALNEASDVINPGGRLHDDFNGENKDVYVENFAEDQIFARIRLDEYFEITMNKGTGAETTEIVTAGAEKSDPNTYVTHLFGEENATDTYWAWATGGSTVYMPTFNMNKDSLAADINGVYEEGNVGSVTDRDGTQYTDYAEYAEGDIKVDSEVYDADANSVEDEGITTVNGVEHVAKSTLGAGLISMQEWKDLGSPIGEYWVYDADGWVYWAQPIEGGTATGLLLDAIEPVQVMDDSWYYAINVVAQFVTADDLGRGSGTGFYDLSAGKAPSSEALELLEAIGVDVTSIVSDEASLKDALAAGGDIVINGTIVADEAPSSESYPTIDTHFLMSEGGVLSGGTIESTEWTDSTLFINNENNWPIAGDGANEATVNDTAVNAATSWGVRMQALDASVTLNDMVITGEYGGLIAEYSQSNGQAGGSNQIVLNDLSINAQSNYPHAGYEWINSAVAAGYGANVVINGGSYVGSHAIYVLSTGANVTINGGYFDGALKTDASGITVYGGTFTSDPSEFVAAGFETVYNGDGTWTVQEAAAPAVTLTYSVVEPENWDGALARRGETSVTLKVDGDYSADDLVWEILNPGGADCLDSEVVENEDGSATVSHTGTICGGGGGTVRVSLVSDPSVHLDIEIGCDV